MARTKNIEKQVALLDEKIQKHQDALKELQREKSELLKEKKQQDVDSLYSMINEKGLSVEEVKNLLDSKN